MYVKEKNRKRKTKKKWLDMIEWYEVEWWSEDDMKDWVGWKVGT